jgi:CBS domain-containing protein
MSRPVIALRPDQTIGEAIGVLAGRGVSGAPVLDDHKAMLGIVSEFDCMRVIAAGEFHQEAQVRSKTVAELMTPVRFTVTADADLYAVCNLFVQSKVRRLPVVEQSRIIGIITRRDVIKAMARYYR